MKMENPRSRAYKIVSMIILVILAILFLFPLYWIITGAFKPAADIYAQEPVLWPTEWVSKNFENLFNKRTAPLFSIFGIEGPTAPAAFRWLINTVFMSVASMLLTCLTAAMAGYALAKKRFVGRAILFSLIVCAMALPKQVILIPLLKEMAALKLYDSLWAVIFPTVGWPFGVFLMKQFSESIPGEILEATRIDGASEAKTFVTVVLPMVMPWVKYFWKRRNTAMMGRAARAAPAISRPISTLVSAWRVAIPRGMVKFWPLGSMTSCMK